MKFQVQKRHFLIASRRGIDAQCLSGAGTIALPSGRWVSQESDITALNAGDSVPEAEECMS